MVPNLFVLIEGGFSAHFDIALLQSKLGRLSGQNVKVLLHPCPAVKLGGTQKHVVANTP
jgi:hypothetical protein